MDSAKDMKHILKIYLRDIAEQKPFVSVSHHLVVSPMIFGSLFLRLPFEVRFRLAIVEPAVDHQAQLCFQE